MRTRVPKAFRRLILKRQKHKCAVCSMFLDVYDIDHIIPYRVYPVHKLNNLQALCPNCHARKTRKEQKYIQLFIDCEKTKSYRYCWICKKVYSAYFGCCLPDIQSLKL